MYLQFVDHYFRGEPEIRLIKLLLKDHGNAIDVGANIGVYTFFMSRHASQVFSFEPNADLAARLEGRFKNTRVFPLAVSDISGEDFLHIPIVDGIAVHEAATLTGRLPHHDDIQEQRIQKARLDDLGLEGIELIKIDVEQHERQVVKGAMSIIKTCRPNLIIEVTPLLYDKPLFAEFKHILELGYRGLFRYQCRLMEHDKFIPEIHANEKNYPQDFMGIM